MKRAHPVSIRNGLEMAHQLGKIGLEFVPIPSLGVQDYSDLVDQLGSRMGSLALQAEADEAGATVPPQPSYRDQIEAIALENVLVRTPLYVLRMGTGAITSYQEALEHMVLALAKHNKNLLRDLVSAQMTSPVPASWSICNTCRKPIEPAGLTGTKCDCSGAHHG